MNTYLLIATIIISSLTLLTLLAVALRRRISVDPENLRPQFDAVIAENRRIEQSARDEFGRQREESSRAATALREEVATNINGGLETLLNRQGEAQHATEAKLESARSNVEERLREFGSTSESRLSAIRQELNESAAKSRTETRQGFADFQMTISNALTTASHGQETQLSNFALRLDNVGQALVQQLDNIRGTVEAKLTALQTGNELKLDEMRRTVDEKLEGTLERRLGESFKLVSDRLDQVHRGLGEMQAMATSVGDLKRVLTNVKTRGTWGEIQLGALLEQMLSPQQYATNVAPKPDSGERVEFAIRLPGRSDADSVLWLPIDSKFPQEDYQRLVDAAERADASGVAEAGKAFESRLRKQARDIRDKYITPPYTTDFAILFLPSEGLYAEAVRRPCLPETLQQEFRVSLAGPSTFAALLNSLQMGFRTLAIQERSSEVWRVLGAVKTEFGKFADVLAAVKKKIDEASKQIDQTGVRTRAISRTLRNVEALPLEEAVHLLPQPQPAEPDSTTAIAEEPLEPITAVCDAPAPISSN
jgi:DNA recombination protein RmuC